MPAIAANPLSPPPALLSEVWGIIIVEAVYSLEANKAPNIPITKNISINKAIDFLDFHTFCMRAIKSISSSFSIVLFSIYYFVITL